MPCTGGAHARAPSACDAPPPLCRRARRTEPRREGRRSVRGDATPAAAGSVRRQAVHHSFTRASPSCAETAEVPRPAMLLLCFRERPVTRPTCMRLLLVPGVQRVLQACTLCSVPGLGSRERLTRPAARPSRRRPGRVRQLGRRRTRRRGAPQTCCDVTRAEQRRGCSTQTD